MWPIPSHPGVGQCMSSRPSRPRLFVGRGFGGGGGGGGCKDLYSMGKRVSNEHTSTDSCTLQSSHFCLETESVVVLRVATYRFRGHLPFVDVVGSVVHRMHVRMMMLRSVCWMRSERTPRRIRRMLWRWWCTIMWRWHCRGLRNGR